MSAQPDDQSIHPPVDVDPVSPLRGVHRLARHSLGVHPHPLRQLRHLRAHVVHVVKLGVGEARTDGGDRHTVLLQLEGQRFREGDHPGLHGAVQGVPSRPRKPAGDGGDVHHPAPSALAHRPGQPPGKVGHRADHDLQEGLVHVPRLAEVGAGHPVARVVHQHVHLEPALPKRRLDVGRCLRPRKIGRQHIGLHAMLGGQLRGQLREPVGPPGRKDEVVAPPCHFARDGLADPGRGARDQGGPAPLSAGPAAPFHQSSSPPGLRSSL